MPLMPDLQHLEGRCSFLRGCSMHSSPMVHPTYSIPLWLTVCGMPRIEQSGDPALAYSQCSMPQVLDPITYRSPPPLLYRRIYSLIVCLIPPVHGSQHLYLCLPIAPPEEGPYQVDFRVIVIDMLHFLSSTPFCL